jgi:hypothetical protein
MGVPRLPLSEPDDFADLVTCEALQVNLADSRLVPGCDQRPKVFTLRPAELPAGRKQPANIVRRPGDGLRIERPFAADFPRW